MINTAEWRSGTSPALGAGFREFDSRLCNSWGGTQSGKAKGAAAMLARSPFTLRFQGKLATCFAGVENLGAGSIPVRPTRCL